MKEYQIFIASPQTILPHNNPIRDKSIFHYKSILYNGKKSWYAFKIQSQKATIKDYAMRSGLRSLLEARNITFLKKKLEIGEISPEECKEVMKRLILKKYGRIKNRSFRASILGFERTLESKTLVES